MTAERISRADRWIGCVVLVETGVFTVLTDRGQVRASLDGSMLGAVARDRSTLPEAGDWVELREWCDGRVTLCRSLHWRLCPVVPLRRRTG